MIKFNLSSFRKHYDEYYDGQKRVAKSWDKRGDSIEEIDYFFDDGNHYGVSSIFDSYFNHEDQDLVFDGRLHLWREEEC